MVSLGRRAVAEATGTLMLLATVVGSGIMGERLSGGNVGIALLANAVATGAVLVALILTFGPLSGAHFNPAVTLTEAYTKGLAWRDVPVYDVRPLFLTLSGHTLQGRTGSPRLPRFANPAVTIARSISNTFTGIRPLDVPGLS